MTRQEMLQQKLTDALAPVHIEVENESYKHSVPKGSETHFKVTIVSAAFEGEGAVDRHRRVYGVLADEMKRGVHALTMRLLTPEQWAKEGGTPFTSPPCLGGSKAG